MSAPKVSRISLAGKFRQIEVAKLIASSTKDRHFVTRRMKRIDRRIGIIGGILLTVVVVAAAAFTAKDMAHSEELWIVDAIFLVTIGPLLIWDFFRR